MFIYSFNYLLPLPSMFIYSVNSPTWTHLHIYLLYQLLGSTPLHVHLPPSTTRLQLNSISTYSFNYLLPLPSMGIYSFHYLVPLPSMGIYSFNFLVPLHSVSIYSIQTRAYTGRQGGQCLFLEFRAISLLKSYTEEFAEVIFKKGKKNSKFFSLYDTRRPRVPMSFLKKF